MMKISDLRGLLTVVAEPVHTSTEGRFVSLMALRENDTIRRTIPQIQMATSEDVSVNGTVLFMLLYSESSLHTDLLFENIQLFVTYMYCQCSGFYIKCTLLINNAKVRNPHGKLLLLWIKLKRNPRKLPWIKVTKNYTYQVQTK